MSPLSEMPKTSDALEIGSLTPVVVPGLKSRVTAATPPDSPSGSAFAMMAPSSFR